MAVLGAISYSVLFAVTTPIWDSFLVPILVNFRPTTIPNEPMILRPSLPVLIISGLVYPGIPGGMLGFSLGWMVQLADPHEDDGTDQPPNPA